MLLPVWVFSCHYWFELILILILILVLVLFGYCCIFFFFDICHVVNIKFIGWYIMYFCHPIFFFLQKFTTWHIDHHPILFFLFNSKQNTEAKTQQNYHTHRGDDWRLTTVLLKTMAGVGRQFILLLWKNWLLQKRKACVTVFEIVMPIVFAVILVCIRLIAKNETISQSTIWPPFKPNDVMLRGSQIEILYSPNTTDIQTMMNTFRNFLPGLGITLDFGFFPSFMFLF